MNKVVRTIEISTELDAALEQLAKESGRTREEMLTEALERFVADPDDIAIDLDRLAEFERTGEALSLEEVEERLDKLKQRTARAT
jgi:predicted transcriptional regulator